MGTVCQIIENAIEAKAKTGAIGKSRSQNGQQSYWPLLEASANNEPRSPMEKIALEIAKENSRTGTVKILENA